VVIEPGSGSSEKVRLLLEALAPSAYVPLDISSEFLQQAVLKLGEEFPWLQIHAICADFASDWSLPEELPAGKRIVFYPGSTIGNLEPSAAAAFLKRMRQWMRHGGAMLVGVDLHKSTERLNAAYNDASGVTADFNLNLLRHLGEVLDAGFDLDKFRHRAFYDESRRRIEMHLESKVSHVVRGDGVSFEFAEGETIHTENSYKYTLDSFTELAATAGFTVQRSWLDEDALFSVNYLVPAA
jgi:dimethylhistidine N-methyltransferase